MAAAPGLPQEQVGPAEQLLALVLNSSAHLWHNRAHRPGAPARSARVEKVMGTPLLAPRPRG